MSWTTFAVLMQSQEKIITLCSQHIVVVANEDAGRFIQDGDIDKCPASAVQHWHNPVTEEDTMLEKCGIIINGVVY
jgi:hypothetical protein